MKQHLNDIAIACSFVVILLFADFAPIVHLPHGGKFLITLGCMFGIWMSGYQFRSNLKDGDEE